jgi:hypothetical protein
MTIIKNVNKHINSAIGDNKNVIGQIIADDWDKIINKVIEKK